MEKTLPIRSMVLAALFTALLVVGARFSFPIPLIPVPITVANLFPVMAGMVLGPLWGGATVGSYLALGLLGFPVFARTQGFAAFAGPTGGFLVGYLLAALVAGLLAPRAGFRKTDILAWTRLVLAAVLGFASIYLLGIPWFAHTQALPLSESVGKVLIPFLVPDALKAVAAILLVPAIQVALREADRR